MTELWIKLSDTGWGFWPGHTTAHFMLKSPISNRWPSACGQILLSNSGLHEIFKAEVHLKKCGRCVRTLAKHPEWEENLITGIWSSAIGSTRQHQWEWYPLSDKWLSRCGVIRSKDEVGKMDAKTLAMVGVSDRIYIPDCQKCLDYLGIDERKRPDETTLNDEGRTVSVKMMAGVKPGYYTGEIPAERLKDTGRYSVELELPGGEAVESQQILLPVDSTGIIMDNLIQAALTSYIEYVYDGVAGFSSLFLCIPSEDQNE